MKTIKINSISPLPSRKKTTSPIVFIVILVLVFAVILFLSATNRKPKDKPENQPKTPENQFKQPHFII